MNLLFHFTKNVHRVKSLYPRNIIPYKKKMSRYENKYFEKNFSPLNPNIRLSTYFFIISYIGVIMLIAKHMI